MTIRVERFRVPALRAFAVRGVPIPPGHIGALQRAARGGEGAAGEPIVVLASLAARLGEVLSRGARLTQEEGLELARRIEAARGPQTAPTAAAEISVVENAVVKSVTPSVEVVEAGT